MKRKRSTEIFSLSFLDCICCGFGAIILLFVISMGAQTRRIDDLQTVLESMISQRVMKLNEYQVETEEISIRLAMTKESILRKQESINDLEAMIAKLKQQMADNSSSKDKFLVDLESLKKEIGAMQTDTEIEQKVIKPTPVGIPVDSTHIAFVIDTSGSMRDGNTNLIWSYVIQKFQEALDSYPEVKGIQVLDADGQFIVGRSMSSKWIEDSPETRLHLLRSVRLYPRNSNSNPVPGIMRAIRILHDKEDEDMKMGIYVFGDEFTGKSDNVLKVVKQLNTDKDGERISRINAIGFPNVIGQGMSLGLGQSGLKFANLMRELTYAHGGAFIALEKESLKAIDREHRKNNPIIRQPQPTIGRPRIIYN